MTKILFSLALFQQPQETPIRSQIFDFVGNNVLNLELFKLGDSPVKVSDVIVFIIALLIFVILAKALRRYLVNRLLRRANFRAETTQLTGIIFQYTFITLGFIITLQAIGVDLTGLNVLAGAIGIAIGFGLQNIASNFISGLIIVFESPFSIGDRIEIDKIVGKVVEIGGRSTKVLGDDEATYIIPNQKLIIEPVRNVRHELNYIPFEIKIIVGYGNDANKVLDILQKVADNDSRILQEPKPSPRLKAFDVNKLDFVLNVWISKGMPGIDKFLGDINAQIYTEFLKNDIASISPISANVNLNQPSV
ncbi:MAG: mechanosensitive ion channel [Pyrinomonadaceae bacterium]|nr:mechanosensitive ion channel [Pyrinomonadaceae bacterium]